MHGRVGAASNAHEARAVGAELAALECVMEIEELGAVGERDGAQAPSDARDDLVASPV